MEICCFVLLRVSGCRKSVTHLSKDFPPQISIFRSDNGNYWDKSMCIKPVSFGDSITIDPNSSKSSKSASSFLSTSDLVNQGEVAKQETCTPHLDTHLFNYDIP